MASPSPPPLPPETALRVSIPSFCALALLLDTLCRGTSSRFLTPFAWFATLGLVSLLLAWVVRRFPRWRVLIAPLGAGILLFAIYTALSTLIPDLLPEDREWSMLAFDRQVLGYFWEPVWTPLLSAWFTDFLQAVYTSFYILPFAFGLWFYLKKDVWGLLSGVDRVILGFLLSYCGYMLMPVRSPYAFLHYATPLPTLGLRPILHGHLINTSWTKRDCFPSGHTMMSAYIAWLAWTRLRPAALLFIPWSFLTIVATLYLRYHYLGDVLAGLVACLGWIWISERLFGPYAAGPRPTDS